MKSVFGILILSFLGLTFASRNGSIGIFRNGCVYSGDTYNEGNTFGSSGFTLECKNKIWNFKGIDKKSCDVCHLQDDPHIISFDREFYHEAYHWHGICNYSLSQETICDVSSSYEPKYAVYGDFVLCNGGIASCVDSTTIRIDPNTVVTINHKTSAIVDSLNINGNTFSPLPSTPSAVLDPSGNFYPAIVWRWGDCAYVLSDTFSIKACHHDLFIYASKEYMKNLVGLCGFYSGDPSDDFVPRGQCFTPAPFTDFGISWLSDVFDKDCDKDRDYEINLQIKEITEACKKDEYYGICQEKIIAGHRNCEEYGVINEAEINTAIDNCVLDCCINKDGVEEWTENAFKMATIACETNLMENGIIIGSEKGK